MLAHQGLQTHATFRYNNVASGHIWQGAAPLCRLKLFFDVAYLMWLSSDHEKLVNIHTQDKVNKNGEDDFLHCGQSGLLKCLGK